MSQSLLSHHRYQQIITRYGISCTLSVLPEPAKKAPWAPATQTDTSRPLPARLLMKPARQISQNGEEGITTSYERAEGLLMMKTQQALSLAHATVRFKDEDWQISRPYILSKSASALVYQITLSKRGLSA